MHPKFQQSCSSDVKKKKKMKFSFLESTEVRRMKLVLLITGAFDRCHPRKATPHCRSSARGNEMPDPT